MPNWCNTSYRFEGNKEEIADLYKKLQSLDESPEPLVENGFGKLWLGCVVTLFGGDWNKIECRGEIDDVIELDSETNLCFTTTTAWVDKPEVWDFVLKNYPSITYYYLVEEPGCCYYITNDIDGKYFPDRFIVDQYDAETTYHATKETLLKDISERIGVELNSKSHMQRELSVWNDRHEEEDDCIYVHEIEVVE